jgi:hypothetical protein
MQHINLERTINTLFDGDKQTDDSLDDILKVLSSFNFNQIKLSNYYNAVYIIFGFSKF